MQNTNTSTSGLFGGALLRAGLVAAAAASPAAADPIAFTENTAATGVGLSGSVAVGDLDGDGRQDIVTGSWDSIRWHRGDGGSPAVFTETASYTFSYEFPDALTVADVNGDGFDDVLYGYQGVAQAPTLRLIQNSGNASDPFSAGADYLGPYLGGRVRGMDVADLDADGDLDVIAVGGYPETVLWLENNGGPNPSFSTRTISTSVDGESVAVGDVDGDGSLDIVVGLDDGTAVWFESNGAANPQFTQRSLGSVGSGRVQVALGDADGDGDTDVYFGRSTSNTVGSKAGWLENNGGSPPSFAGPQFFELFNKDVRTVLTTDLDGDGDMDLVGQIGASTDHFRWWENDGAADPTFTQHTVATYGAGQLRDTLAAGDLDGDGDSEVVIMLGQQVRWFDNGSDPLPVITTQPLGQFLTAPDQATFTVVATGATTYRWQLGDRDLPPDPLFSGQETATLRVDATLSTQGVYRCIVGNAAGDVISTEVILGVQAAPSTCLGDLNGDGTTDVFDFAEFAFDFGCVAP